MERADELPENGSARGRPGWSESIRPRIFWPANRPALRSLNALPTGVFLENRRILLPWGAGNDQLVRAAHPDLVTNGGAWREFTWREPRLFDLRARSVQVVLFPYGWMDLVSVVLGESYDRRLVEARYRESLSHLAGNIGEPDQIGKGMCAFVRQEAQWQRGAVHMSLVFKRSEQPEEMAYSCLLTLHRPS